jgi:hypothetical protein
LSFGRDENDHHRGWVQCLVISIRAIWIRASDDGIHDREDEWLTLGRGLGSAVARDSDEDIRDRDNDWREARDREPGDRDHDVGSLDPRDVFMRDLDLPRGPERELVHDRDRDYS